MKICAKCGLSKDENQYHYQDKAKGTLKSICKICAIERAKGYYKDRGKEARELRGNKSKQTRDSMARVRTRNKALVLEYLKKNPCVDCGEGDLEVLQFDHVEMLKSRRGRIVDFLGSSVARLMSEIAKCEVRCANCHTRRTRKQMGWERSI